MHRKKISVAHRLGTALSRLRPRPILLPVVGFALLAVAAGTIAVGWGLAVAGLGCLIMEWRVTS